MGKYKAVLFDYDGTIADSNKIISESWQHLGQVYLGKPFPNEIFLKTFGLTLIDSMVMIAHEYGFPDDPDSIEKMRACYSEYQYSHYSAGYPVFPGMVELIKKLHQDGIKLGIVTSRLRNSLCEGLELHNIKECFGSIICAESTEIHKPDPYPAQLCLKELGVKPEEAIMIGDSKYDIACGNNAGCDSCFVKWSFSNTQEEINEYSPSTYSIETAEEFYKLVTE